MRIRDDYASDVLVPLVPEWPSLTARARGAPGKTPVLSCTRKKSSQSNSYETFELVFKDQSRALLKWGCLSAHSKAWVLWLGDGPRDHDLLNHENSETLALTELESSYLLKSSKGQLRISKKDGSFQILDSRDIPIWTTVGPDLLVGDVPMNYGIFRHQDGFGISLDMGTTKHILGGGEQFGSINLQGRVYDIMNSDALGVNGHLRYQSTPFFVTESGQSLAMLASEPGRIDFGSTRHGISTFSSDGPSLGLYLADASSARESIIHWRDLMGATRGVPDWSYGLWLSRCFYKDEHEVRDIISKNKELGLGASVINLDARAWMRATTRTDFVWDESRWSPFKEFIPWLRKQGFHVCLWENPYVSSATETVYQQGVSQGYFAKDSSGNVYPYQWVPTGLEGFPQPPIAGLVDFTNPSARTWWKDMHRPYLRSGVTCFKTDFGEEIPFDAVFSDGSTGKQLRNVYSDLYNLCVMEVLEEECGDQGILWARSGYTKMAQTPVKWAGDSQTSWSALRASLRGGLSQAAGGALFWSHDIGGFYGPMPSPELYLRWAQVGLWGSHARMHGTSPREPWEFGESVLAQVKKDVAFRNSIRDYFVECGKACISNRQSFIQPLWLAFSKDDFAWTIDDQFFAGSKDVMVAPYLTPEGGRRVYLPKGQWFCLANQKQYEGREFYDLERYPETLVFIDCDSKWLARFKSVAAASLK